MPSAFAIDDHAPLLALIAEQLHIEAEALEASQDEVQRLLHAGGVLTLARVASEEANRLATALLATSPDRDSAPTALSDES